MVKRGPVGWWRSWCHARRRLPDGQARTHPHTRHAPHPAPAPRARAPAGSDGAITIHYNNYEEGSKVGTPASMEVDLVIGADGANSRVAKEIDAGEYDYAIAFQERIRIPGAPSVCVCIWGVGCVRLGGVRKEQVWLVGRGGGSGLAGAGAGFDTPPLPPTPTNPTTRTTRRVSPPCR